MNTFLYIHCVYVKLDIGYEFFCGEVRAHYNGQVLSTTLDIATAQLIIGSDHPWNMRGNGDEGYFNRLVRRGYILAFERYTYRLTA